MITEIVQPEIRGSIIGFWIGIETVISAFSAPAAAYLAQDVFGYQTSVRPVAEMSEPERLANADALANALMWTMMLPWVPCFIFYTLMHWTYKKDKAEYHAELAILLEGGDVDESMDSAAYVLLFGRFSATFSPNTGAF